MRNGDGGLRHASVSLERRAGGDTFNAIVTQDSGFTSPTCAACAPAPRAR